MSETSSKPKDQQLKDRIGATPDMTVVFGGDGRIKSVEGGGHDTKMLQEEFNFEDSYLDCTNYEGGTVSSILDMKAYTLLTLEIKDPKGDSRIVNYLWESTRHWW